MMRHTEIIDGRPCIIGRGEDLVKQILEIFFPRAYIGRQILLSKIIPVEQNWRQEKESLDLAVWQKGDPENDKPDFVVRVQNDKGDIRAGHEARQKTEIEKEEIKVVDINEYECTEVFAERFNYLSIFEVSDALRRADIKP